MLQEKCIFFLLEKPSSALVGLNNTFGFKKELTSVPGHQQVTTTPTMLTALLKRSRTFSMATFLTISVLTKASAWAQYFATIHDPNTIFCLIIRPQHSCRLIWFKLWINSSPLLLAITFKQQFYFSVSSWFCIHMIIFGMICVLISCTM